MPDHQKLTNKQELFISEYIIDKNSTQAAIRAGYSIKAAYAIGYENLRKPQIKSKVDKIFKDIILKNELNAEFVINGIKDIAKNGVKQADKLKAYELLGKHLKLFTDKTEVENTNYNIDCEDMTDKELEDSIKALEAKESK